MSIYTTIARPYAKAAFEYAVAHKAVEAWAIFLQKAALIVSDQRVVNLFSNPQVTSKQKIDFLEALFEEGTKGQRNIDKEQMNFIRILSTYQRLIAIPEITLFFEKYVRESNKIIDVNVVSAFPMDDDQEQRLVKALKIRLQQDIKLNVEIDPAIIGGAVIRTDNNLVIDGSCREQLDLLRQALLA